MDNSTQNIQKGRALAGFGKVFSGIGVVILVAGVILSATPAIAAGVILAVIGAVNILFAACPTVTSWVDTNRI